MKCSIILKPAGDKPEYSIELGVLHSNNYHVHAVWILIDSLHRLWIYVTNHRPVNSVQFFCEQYSLEFKCFDMI